jgi:hypothetical protein
MVLPYFSGWRDPHRFQMILLFGHASAFMHRRSQSTLNLPLYHQTKSSMIDKLGFHKAYFSDGEVRDLDDPIQ